jgi:hypothetical protein
MSTAREQTGSSRQLRDRVRQTMALHNRCDVEISELLRVWENQIDDDKDIVEDFFLWCRRSGWRAGRGVTVPRVIVTK